MKIENPTKEKLIEYNKNLREYIEKNNTLIKTLYLDLGVQTVRILCYSELFIPHIVKQLSYVLKYKAEKYDATIILWNEKNPDQIYKYIIPELNPKYNFTQRIKMLQRKQSGDNLQILDNNYSPIKPLISTNLENKTVNSYDASTQTYLYGVKNLEPEEFIKEGHIFVQILNNILKTENTNLVHGACVGLNNKGILLCARGQRGKSTLAVLAMMEGFEYVSDDYLTLEKDESSLYARPIYSIITLSPRMYNELYDRMDGCRFLSNNARKDKYVFEISKFHKQFKKKYPIKLCMFPEIVSDTEPSVKECTVQEKGRAITHIVHSTVFQMQDRHDIKTIQKLMNMVKDFKFYKINLCNDIYKNVECMKKFMKEYKNDKF
ncbi:hypothetical protein IJ750_01690 [bacterium]|nr:hypothetical protein [bacterium]